jgi:hypothetical protein
MLISRNILGTVQKDCNLREFDNIITIYGRGLCVIYNTWFGLDDPVRISIGPSVTRRCVWVWVCVKLP